MRDNVNKLGTASWGLTTATIPIYTASVNGASVDLAPYNAATVYILAGTWTDGTHAFTVQESADNSAWSNVAATDLSRLETANAAGGLPITQSTSGSQPASITSSATALNQRVGYLGGLRYIRVITTVSGTTTGARYAAIIVAGEPRVLPAAV